MWRKITRGNGEQHRVVGTGVGRGTWESGGLSITSLRDAAEDDDENESAKQKRDVEAAGAALLRRARGGGPAIRSTRVRARLRVPVPVPVPAPARTASWALMNQQRLGAVTALVLSPATPRARPWRSKPAARRLPAPRRCRRTCRQTGATDRQGDRQGGGGGGGDVNNSGGRRQRAERRRQV